MFTVESLDWPRQVLLHTNSHAEMGWVGDLISMVRSSASNCLKRPWPAQQHAPHLTDSDAHHGHVFIDWLGCSTLTLVICFIVPIFCTAAGAHTFDCNYSLNLIRWWWWAAGVLEDRLVPQSIDLASPQIATFAHSDPIQGVIIWNWISRNPQSKQSEVLGLLLEAIAIEWSCSAGIAWSTTLQWRRYNTCKVF